MEEYKVPGQFEYNGVIYFDRVQSELDLDIADGWRVDKGDVLIASYPKSGEFNSNCIFYYFTSIMFARNYMGWDDSRQAAAVTQHERGLHRIKIPRRRTLCSRTVQHFTLTDHPQDPSLLRLLLQQA